MSIVIDQTGRTVLVAGGRSGLGVARRFAEAGAAVHVTGTRAVGSTISSYVTGQMLLVDGGITLM